MREHLKGCRFSIPLNNIYFKSEKNNDRSAK
nr:MAG TPA: hypothetical protein [Caudoviricetes sp.]